jgi:hypothetical protein
MLYRELRIFQIVFGCMKHNLQSNMKSKSVNSNIIGAPYHAEGLRCVMHQQIHKNDRIKILRLAELF